MMAMDDVLAALNRAGGVKVVILDACRNNPVVDVFRQKISGASRAVENVRGLARIDKTEGMIVAYATAIDEVAADGTARNSPYTGALLKHLQEPGLEIEIMFRRIAADVNAQTNGRQRPETYISLINEYHLNQQDQQAWEKIKDLSDPALFNDFIRRYPASRLAPDALARERQIENEAADRRAAQMREEEQRRAQASATERQRAEREAAQRRQQEEQRMKLAALERERLEAAEAQRLREEEQRRQHAEAERQKQEQEAALARVTTISVPQDQACKRDSEQLARLRASQDRDEVIRLERALSCEKLRPQVMRLRESLVGSEDTASRGSQARSSEPDPPDPGSAQPAPGERRGKTEADRQRSQSEPILKSAPLPESQEETCRRDAEKLARLRVSRSREEVIRFVLELTCERLRPQALRLRESVAAD